MTKAPIGRRAAFGAALAATTLVAPAIGQGRFPNRPVRFLIPWAPGGTLDGFMRLQAELFQQDTGQSLVIENRPGARGTLAAQALLPGAAGRLHAGAPPPLGHPPPLPDQAAHLAPGERFHLHHAADRLRIRPRGAPGIGLEHARRHVGRGAPAAGRAHLRHLRHRHIQPHRDGGALREGRRADDACALPRHRRRTSPRCSRARSTASPTPMRGSPIVEAGQMKLLAVWTRQRLRSLPDAPTLLDLGYGMVVTSPYGVAGPKGMDPELVETVHQIFRKTQSHPRVQEYMRRTKCRTSISARPTTPPSRASARSTSSEWSPA